MSYETVTEQVNGSVVSRYVLRGKLRLERFRRIGIRNRIALIEIGLHRTFTPSWPCNGYRFQFVTILRIA
ncbi:MAG: hypothetical protein AAF740_01370 [Bacteroidota bacterium]